jgi:hypothetical protein
MSGEGSVVIPSEGTAAPGGVKPRSRWFRLVRECAAMWIWLYVILKLFVFDFDVWLVNLLVPSLSWLLDYKFLIVLAALACISMISNKKGFFLFAAFVAFYPLIVVFWRVPWLVIKQQSWVLFFALFNFVVGFVQSIKHTLIALSIYLISFTAIMLGSAKPLLYVSGVSLFLVLTVSFIRRFSSVFKGDKLFQFYHRAVPWMRGKAFLLIKVDDGIRNLPVSRMDATQVSKWTSSLEQSVLVNRVLLFSARKVRDHQKSPYGVLLGVIATIFLWIATVVTFTAINLAAYKIEPTSFSATAPPTFFTFVHYSFKAMFIATISELTAISPLSQSIEMLNNFYAFLTYAIVLAAFIAMHGQRYNTQLDELIGTLEREGKEAEAFIRSEFKLSIDDALAELVKLKSGLLNILLHLTTNLK